mgnify:CR=1 FL=1
MSGYLIFEIGGRELAHDDRGGREQVGLLRQTGQDTGDPLSDVEPPLVTSSQRAVSATRRSLPKRCEAGRLSAVR